MRRRLCWWLILLTILPLAKPAAAASDTESGKLKFALYRDYLIVVRGSVGPLKNLNFLVDTGASPTVLDRNLAKKLNLVETPTNISVLDGSVLGSRAEVSSLQLGPLERDSLPVLVEDLTFFLKALPVRIDAVVGLDVLGKTPFEIDYPSQEIHFGAFSPLKNSLPFEIRAGLPIIDAELNHTLVHLLVDTGSPSLILFGPSTPRPVSPVRVSQVNSIGESERRQVWLEGVKLGQTQFGTEPAYMVRSRTDGRTELDGLMSPVALGIRKIAVDCARGEFSFSR
jgi:predicted aspartyl protease